ncbi:MAG: flagellar biosynthetic protein FliR [Desulfobacterales bacterium]|nr:flagellar biosynthetic protein FliR [Desulfobacterales bacterium]
MDILNIYTPEHMKIFTLILIRTSVMIFMFPLLGSPMFPMFAKAGLSIIISFLLYPIVPVTPEQLPDNVIDGSILVVSETLIGFSLSLTVTIFFGAIQLTGQLISMQMGLSMINVVDPQTGANVSIMDQIGYWVVLLVFLILNGHYMMISVFVDSFRLIQLGQFDLKYGLLRHFFDQTTILFELGIKIGAPAIAALMFTNVAFGIIGKFSPQMNIMMVAFPFNIGIGLVLFGVSLDIILSITQTYLIDFRTLLNSIIVWLRGG